MAAHPIPLYQGDDWDKLSDRTVEDIFTEEYCKIFKIDIEQFSASQEMSERFEGLALRTVRSTDMINEISNEIAIKYDFPYGIALPAISNDNSEITSPVLARGTPMAHVNIVDRVTEYAQRLRVKGVQIRNSWEALGDKSISVVNSTDGPMAIWEYHAGNRVRKFMDSLQARMDSTMSVESEEKAIALLKTKISASQYRCYMLNGAFPESSKRSPGIFYFFRKGLPVVVISFNKVQSGKILCCLCIHPYGYYEYTTAGVMCPTDEVIAQLLLMRANEHKFWAKSGQWQASDPRACL